MKLNFDKLIWKNVTAFIEKKSFYIMVVLCIGIVVFSGLFVTSKNIISSIGYESQLMNEGENDDYPVDFGQKENSFEGTQQMLDVEGVDSQIMENTQSSEISPSTKDYQNDRSKEANVKSRKLAKNRRKAVIKQSEGVSSINDIQNKAVLKGKEKILNQMVPVSNPIKEDKILFELPVIGTITNGFSGDKLLYSKTLNEWRNHDGIDITAIPGTQIKAVASGIITEVINDPRFGFTVIIEHNSNLKTVYSAMAQSQMVSPNQKVKTGEAIGSLGNTASFESLEPAHLHFEVVKNGKRVDPLIYLTQLEK